MKRKVTLLVIIFTCSIIVFSQNPRTTINITTGETSVASYTDNEIIINGKSNLHIIGTTNLLTNSIIKLNSEDSWVFFDNVRPSVVLSTLLPYIYINNESAVLKTNVRVSIYKQGTVVIPQSSSFKPLEVFTGQSFTGDSTSYSLFTYNNSLGATFDNKVRSFKLKRGYMATLASSADGMGYSRVYIADANDLEISVLPTLLDKSISFIRVFDWEWVTKKGWCGTATSDLGLLNATWCYDWSAYAATNAYSEYVPMHAKLTWAPFSQINGLQYVTHSLGFNEPDHGEQHKDDNGGNPLTVAQALAQWPDMIKSGLRLGAPACTNFSWLYQFMDSCKARNYRVDYVAVHAYWGGKSPQNWYNDLKYIHDRTGRPIWITEWNNGANWTTEWWPTDVASQQAKQLADLKGILQVLDTAQFIERYSIYNWVEDKRAVILNGILTPAGQYYATDNSAMAFNKKYEVIPTFTISAPSLSASFTTNKLILSISDPNAEAFNGFILEKKNDGGDFSEIFRSENPLLITYSDTVDINASKKVRYRVRTILSDGSLTNYSNEIGFDVTNGNEIQYGNLSFSNVGWNTVFFKQGFTTTSLPAIILGAPTNFNSTVLLSPRAKLISATSHFNIQLSAWSYQNVSSLTKEETVPYFILGSGSYNFGGLKALAGKTTATSLWRSITFDTPFDTIPVVFATQLNPSTVNATDVRVRNVTKTGFDVKLQKETAVKLIPTPETISFFAITTGTGIVDNKKIIVGKTTNTAISPYTYTKINYGDSIANPIFIGQLQTCNDDTVTATLRCLSITDKYANVVKQRERSTTAYTASTEAAGWMVIEPMNIVQGTNISLEQKLTIYPNPAKDFISIKGSSLENYEVEIDNMVGLLVKRVNTISNKIDIQDLPPGCYIIRTKNQGSMKFIKL